MPSSMPPSTKVPPAALKNRRGLETRDRILAVARELISAHGYSEVTLDQVSARAGVAKSSLLWHFGSKEMLLAQAATSLFEDFGHDLGGVARHAGKTPPQRLENLFDELADYFTANPEAKGVVLGLLFSGGVPASVREQIRHSWDAHVRDLAEVLSVPGQPLPPEMSRLIVATLHGCYVHWYASDRSEPIAGFLAPARTLFSDWLRARAG
ncbi:TetR/AcrR family transcriptional regulator [Cupriavidus oxalaticus]|uniref:TetR/AcrR family transcriptional regulator n=2 Tax=Cupriavidus oxalaticus TaxID=96344 RepID=A0A5P3VQK3_9BURK|nr:TetR/AcrR family transcriptional regulator [Cupriavidus oxalaticus]QRQ87449.1 TetR/AcrR family transcriptional regulator [Cupriavidus oxalaticus]QRQ94223.1 TetR/AcrR family transcriptional regulator [Cupriavidus oxalaticus]